MQALRRLLLVSAQMRCCKILSPQKAQAPGRMSSFELMVRLNACCVARHALSVLSQSTISRHQLKATLLSTICVSYIDDFLPGRRWKSVRADNDGQCSSVPGRPTAQTLPAHSKWAVEASADKVAATARRGSGTPFI